MKKQLILFFLILLLSSSQVTFAKDEVTEATPFENVSTETEQGDKKAEDPKMTDSNEDNAQEVSETKTESTNTKPNKSDDDKTILNKKELAEIENAKKDAVNYANTSLFGEYYTNQSNTINGLFEGSIKEETDTNISDDSIKGYLQETVILSLDDCIRKALENNPKIRSAFSNSEIYKTKIGQAWSNYFPTFKMTNGYTRNRYLTVNFPVAVQEYSFFNAVNLTGSQLLFDFGKTKSIVDVSKKTYESTVANLDETINKIIYDVKEAYYAMLYTLEKVNVYQDSVNSYELQLKQANSFYEIGVRPKIDVTMAEYNLGNAQLGLVKSKNEVKLAIAKLNNAMGLPEENDYKILDKLSRTEYTYQFDELINKAYESRPELLVYKKKAKASEILIKSTKRAFLPNVEAVGNFQVGGGTKFTDDYGWTIGAQMSYGLTNLMLLKKKVEEAKATHQKDLADLEDEEQKLYLQVKNAYINLKNAEESIPIAALSLKHAKEQYDLASGRYTVGYGNAIELKDSENTYRTARLDYLAALLQYNISVADLERVIGSKLQEVNIEE